MPQHPSRIAAIIAAAATAGLSGAAIAGAADSGSSSSTTTTPSASSTHQRSGRGPGAGETALTGATKQKVEAAAVAKVPGGTVLRSETDNGGVYEAHVRKSDGSLVEVKVNKDFEVTAVETAPAGGRGGRGHGGMHADLAAVAKTLGVSQSALQKAVDAARPDKGSGGADFAAAIAKQLGAGTSDVQSVLDANRPDRSAGKPANGAKPDQSALAAALAKKLSITQAKAQAALDAVHKAHDTDRSAQQTAFYTAVAKTLGKDAAAVQKAFEASQTSQRTP